MSIADHILAIDQGTTSSRAIIFDSRFNIKAIAQQEFTQYYPQNGWVEHDPEEIWRTTVEVCKEAIGKIGGVEIIAAIGITNQRETTVIWDRETGEAIYNAIVWQDRRTADTCTELNQLGLEEIITLKTGLLIDPYFSSTKISWILDHVPGARQKAEERKLAFGTIDSFLIWRLTGGKVHATDATNAARTQLYNIHASGWDEQLLEMFNVPRKVLPEVKNCADDFGRSEQSLFGKEIPIAGVAGDQQSASIGQACIEPGMLKSTYGTGCFALMNTGKKAYLSKHRLLTTIAYRLKGENSYALEGSIFAAGAAVQWLRDGLKIIKSASETEALARSLDSNKGVYMVPAFTGLGAPHWDPTARAAITGMTRDTGHAEFARATLESICYQTRDLLTAISDDYQHPASIRVDGGMVQNTWLMEFLADILGIPVERPVITETTALGAAFLAGLQVGLFSSLDDIKTLWQREARFTPNIEKTKRLELLAEWDKAVNRVLGGNL